MLSGITKTLTIPTKHHRALRGARNFGMILFPEQPNRNYYIYLIYKSMKKYRNPTKLVEDLTAAYIQLAAESV